MCAYTGNWQLLVDQSQNESLVYDIRSIGFSYLGQPTGWLLSADGWLTVCSISTPSECALQRCLIQSTERRRISIAVYMTLIGHFWPNNGAG